MNIDGTDLELDYTAVDQNEDRKSSQVARGAGLSDDRAVTFVAAAAVEYETFWKRLLL